MKFKPYEREYERVFSDPNLIEKRCDISKISVFGDDSGSLVAYQNMYAEAFKSFEEGFFQALIRIVWLARKFCYNGIKRNPAMPNGVRSDQAFGVFVRTFIGYDNRFLSGAMGSFWKIANYIDDLFPFFDEGDPIKDPDQFAYPFTYMKLECLTTIYQMDERMDILRYCEERKLSYVEFLDFVLNYINCYNDEHGKKYEFILSYHYMGYVKKLKNNEQQA